MTVNVTMPKLGLTMETGKITDCKSALVGMQPLLRQVPPISRSRWLEPGVRTWQGG